MKLRAIKEFTYFLRGVQPVTFAAGQEFETDDEELSAVAQHEGWAVHADTAVDAEKPAKTKPRKAKSASVQLETDA